MITYAKITGAVNLHFIGAHFRFFHSVSRAELAIQLCVGQRRVWYASWIQQKKKISYSEKARPFPSYKNPHFQNECKTFLVIMSYPCMKVKKTHFHNNGFTLSLALKQWVGATLDYE